MKLVSVKMSMGVPAERVLQAGINLGGGVVKEEASLCHDVISCSTPTNCML